MSPDPDTIASLEADRIRAWPCGRCHARRISITLPGRIRPAGAAGTTRFRVIPDYGRPAAVSATAACRRWPSAGTARGVPGRGSAILTVRSPGRPCPLSGPGRCGDGGFEPCGKTVEDAEAIDMSMVNLFMDRHDMPPGEIVSVADGPPHGGKDGCLHRGDYRYPSSVSRLRCPCP